MWIDVGFEPFPWRHSGLIGPVASSAAPASAAVRAAGRRASRVSTTLSCSCRRRGARATRRSVSRRRRARRSSAGRAGACSGRAWPVSMSARAWPEAISASRRRWAKNAEPTLAFAPRVEGLGRIETREPPPFVGDHDRVSVFNRDLRGREHALLARRGRERGKADQNCSQGDPHNEARAGRGRRIISPVSIGGLPVATKSLGTSTPL